MVNKREAIFPIKDFPVLYKIQHSLSTPHFTKLDILLSNLSLRGGIVTCYYIFRYSGGVYTSCASCSDVFSTL